MSAQNVQSVPTVSDCQLMLIFKRVQQEDLRLLEEGKPVQNSSCLLALPPEVDPDEVIIRVEGRLQRTEEQETSIRSSWILRIQLLNP